MMCVSAEMKQTRHDRHYRRHDDTVGQLIKMKQHIVVFVVVDHDDHDDHRQTTCRKKHLL
eukprot:108139-Rhodomonas_salina.2